MLSLDGYEIAEKCVFLPSATHFCAKIWDFLNGKFLVKMHNFAVVISSEMLYRTALVTSAYGL